MPLVEVSVKDIKPNRFRSKGYPTIEKKVETLLESINSTGFWENIVARKTNDGYELAYGHHRLEAVKRKGLKKIKVLVRDISDEDMFKIMSRENMEDWGQLSIKADLEVIKEALRSCADGVLKLPPLSNKAARCRVAPSAILIGSKEARKKGHTYTTEGLSNLLGWHKEKTKDYLQVLSAVEKGFISEEAFDGLRPSYVLELVEATIAAHKKHGEKVGRAVTTEVRKRLADPKKGARMTRKVAEATVLKKLKVTTPPPEINDKAKELAKKISAFLNKEVSFEASALEEVVHFREYLRGHPRNLLVSALQKNIQYAEQYLSELSTEGLLQ